MYSKILFVIYKRYWKNVLIILWFLSAVWHQKQFRGWSTPVLTPQELRGCMRQSGKNILAALSVTEKLFVQNYCWKLLAESCKKNCNQFADIYHVVNRNVSSPSVKFLKIYVYKPAIHRHNNPFLIESTHILVFHIPVQETDVWSKYPDDDGIIFVMWYTDLPIKVI